MAEMIITLKGEHFKRQYLIYIIEISHRNDKFYYIGQTGDNKHTTARPAFRRLSAHFEDIGQSTQNQIYRYLAVEELKIAEAASRDKAFSVGIKQSVEDYLVTSTVKMYVYVLEPFDSDIQHEAHLVNVRRVTQFERAIIKLFGDNNKMLINKKLTLPKANTKCEYPNIRYEIINDFNLHNNS